MRLHHRWSWQRWRRGSLSRHYEVPALLVEIRSALGFGDSQHVRVLVLRVSEGLDTTVEKVVSDAGYLRLHEVVMGGDGSEGRDVG